MKIFRICPEMPASKKLNTNRLSKKNFLEITDHYREVNLIFPGGWKKTAEDLGHEVMEVVFGDHYSQTQWRIDNDITGGSGLTDILLDQLISFKPDLIIYYTGVLYRVTEPIRREIQRQVPEAVTLSVWGDEVPESYTYEKFFRFVDLIGACSRGYKESFQKAGFRTCMCESAFDQNFLFEDRSDKKDIDVLFIGNTGFQDIDHIKRYVFLDNLFSRVNVKFYGYEKNQSRVVTFSKIAVPFISFLPRPIISFLLKVFRRLFRMAGKDIPLMFSDFVSSAKDAQANRSLTRNFLIICMGWFSNKKPLKKKYRKNYGGEIYDGKSYYEMLSRSKIAINFHRDEDNDFGNIRCFETTGVNTLLLTDRVNDMGHLFDSEEIIGFESAEDCAAKIEELLQDDKKRISITKKGNSRTLENHTLDRRLKRLFEFVEEQRDDCYKDREFLAVPQRCIIYDTTKRPVSFDYAFFLQFCWISMRQNFPRERLKVYIVKPANEDNFSQKYFWSYEEFTRRIENIFVALHRYFPEISYEIIEIPAAQIASKIYLSDDDGEELIKLEEQPHHREFYQMVNAYTHLVRPFEPSTSSLKYASMLLDSFKKDFSKIFSLTIRNSIQFPERNSDLVSLKQFCEVCASQNIACILVDDADNKFEYDLRKWGPNVFLAGDESTKFDKRIALYQLCDDNLFVNNGPCIAAELNPNISSKVFKLVVPSVPHCTVEFIESQGYKLNESPGYNLNSKWVWDDDNISVLKNAFFG